MASAIPFPDENNVWRLDTPGTEGWPRTARADDPNKYFMVSMDGHVQEPADLWQTRMDAKFRDRLPGVAVDKEGKKYQKTEGFRPLRIRNIKFEGEDGLRNGAGTTPEERLADLAADGVDAEVLFPNKGLTIWATPDAEFSQAMCRVWNDWAWEVFGDYNDRLSPMGCVASADIPGAIAEIERLATLGFRGLSLPCKPVWGPGSHEHLNYNLPDFDPLWACIQEVDLPITFHVSTGRDPRTSRGNGGAVSAASKRASAGCPGPSGRSTRRTGNTTCSCGRNWRGCQATTSAGAPSQRSRKTSQASTSLANTTSSTISSGPTTTPTTDDHRGT